MITDSPPLLAPRRRKKFHLSTLLFLALCVSFFLVFSGLGIWQLQRLEWKTALIARVEARLDLSPILAPPPLEWEQVNAENYEYRPVTAMGHFVTGKDILVRAVTKYGTGYWLMQPLRQADNTHIFINRGFVPMNWRDEIKRTQNQKNDNQIGNEVKITGFLRMSEGAGFYPRRNDPTRDRWYSRQLEAFATKTGLENIAPYFIDADARTDTDNPPIGGLTMVTFRNTHLTYAITWFVMAAGAFAAFTFLLTYNRGKLKSNI